MIILYIFGVAVILAFSAAGVACLFGFISVEARAETEDKCICKRSRVAVWANIDCPVHGEKAVK